MRSERGDRKITRRLIRRGDPFSDRRSGEDRRVVYSLVYFQHGNICRRNEIEQRTNAERREGYIRVSEWSSVCPLL